MTYEQLKERIEELKRQREQLMTQANLQLAKLSGSIEALESLVQEEEPEEQGE